MNSRIKTDKVELIVTADGSRSLLNKTLNETYHSRHGAMQESLHVFIRHGLEYVLASGSKTIHIFEVGFGTGLNAWLTFDYTRTQQISVVYQAVETFPLPETIWQELRYTDDERFNTIHQASWNAPVAIAPGFVIQKINRSLQEISFAQGSFDLIYFDAFAPAKQPDMWTQEILLKVSQSLKSKGVLVTYCAKGEVKRNLKQAGLVIETLPGPPGKREMIRANKP